MQLRYQETVDLKEFEPKIQKLLDDHVVALPAETIIGIVNINDPDALKAVVAETGVTDASKADRIASATRRVITEKMDEDPAFYLRFSGTPAGKVARKERGNGIPEAIKGNDDAQAFFGVLDGTLKGTDGINIARDNTAEVALAVIDIVKAHHIVGVWSNDVAQNKMRNAIDDYFFDVMRDQKRIEVPVEMLDELEKRLMNVARARFPD